MKCPKCNSGVYSKPTEELLGVYKCESIFRDDGSLDEQSAECVTRERNILRRRVKQLERLTGKK